MSLLICEKKIVLGLPDVRRIQGKTGKSVLEIHGQEAREKKSPLNNGG
jgi:hypothetical protein